MLTFGQMSAGARPDLAAQLRPLIQALPPAIQPRLMARLERAAADRYRAWATECPEPAAAEGLRACAAREEEVASRVEMLYPAQRDEVRHVTDVLPTIAETYRSALAERPARRQYAIQAAAERGGAAFWRFLASSVADASVREALRGCAELEELSAEFLEALVRSERVTSTGRRVRHV